MEKEKRTTKHTVIIGLISGFSFAIIMALFDYSDKEPFSIFKFLFHFTFFGLIQALIDRYLFSKKQNKS